MLYGRAMKKLITVLMVALSLTAVLATSAPKPAEAQVVCPGCCSVQGIRMCLVPGGIYCGAACGCVGIPGVGYGC